MKLKTANMFTNFSLMCVLLFKENIKEVFMICIQPQKLTFLFFFCLVNRSSLTGGSKSCCCWQDASLLWLSYFLYVISILAHTTIEVKRKR